jgi:hypothetical protein
MDFDHSFGVEFPLEPIGFIGEPFKSDLCGDFNGDRLVPIAWNHVEEKLFEHFNSLFVSF